MKNIPKYIYLENKIPFTTNVNKRKEKLEILRVLSTFMFNNKQKEYLINYDIIFLSDYHIYNVIKN